MSMLLLNNKLSKLTEENKLLKKLVQSTEIEIKHIIKKNQEESLKVRKLLESINPAIENHSSYKITQTKASPEYLRNICELEDSFFQMKELILQLSVQNIAFQKKIERRSKKNKLLDDSNLDYKERINKLVVEKITYQDKIQQQKLLKEAMIAESLYTANEKEPSSNAILRI